MGSSRKNRDRDYDEDYSSSRRRDRSSSRSRKKEKEKYKDDYDDNYSDDDRYSSKKDKKEKRRDRDRYDDDYSSSSKRDSRRDGDERYSSATGGGGGGCRDERGSSYDSRSTPQQPPMNGNYPPAQQPYQQQGPQGYPTSSQGPWGAPAPSQQPQYGSAPQPQSWQSDPRYPPPMENRPSFPPRDDYSRSNSSYPTPPESSYGGQSNYGGGWEPARDPRLNQPPTQPNYGQAPPNQPYPGAPPPQDYDRRDVGRPQYDRTPASAPADTYRREFAQSPAPSSGFGSAPPFAGPPPPIPPPQPSPLAQPPMNASDQWQAYYARGTQAQAQPPTNWSPNLLPPPPQQQTLPATPSPGLDNGAQGHWRAGENGQWTWVVVAPDLPTPPTALQPPTFQPPPVYSAPPPVYPTQVGSLPASYPIYSPPPVPSASAPPSTMNPYVQPQPMLAPQQQMYPPPSNPVPQPQIPQRPPLPPQAASYVGQQQPQQPLYQVVQPVELVQPVQAVSIPSRPRPSAPSAPADSEYSDESRGRRRYDDDDDDDSDYRSRRGRSSSRRRRRRSRSRSSNRSRSRSRARDYVEYEEKHYVKSSEPPTRRESFVEPEEVRYVQDDRRSSRRNDPPPSQPHLVRRIEVYDSNDRAPSTRSGGGETRKVYEMRSLGKGQTSRRESMSSDAERQRQIAAQIAEEEAAILKKRFGSKAKEGRRAEDKSDESWEKVESPVQARRVRRNSVADNFRQNHLVEELEVMHHERARAPAPPPATKPAIDNAKASRIAAWSMAVPTSDVDTLSLEDLGITRPRSAMKGGRAQASAFSKSTLPPVDDLDSVVEPFDPFAPVTTAQSAAAIYPSWQQAARR